MRNFLKKLGVTALAAAVGFGGVLLASPAQQAEATPAGDNVVINELFGRGGSSGASYTHKFIELHNPTDAPIDITGWTLSYRSGTSAGSPSGNLTLDGEIPAGGYWLVQGGSNGSGGDESLPTPDQASGALNLGGGSGTVMLRGETQTGTPATGDVAGGNFVDVVGWGSSNTYEGDRAGNINNNTQSQSRTDGVDSDNNANDFTSGQPTPTNSSFVPETPEEPVATGDLTVTYFNDKNPVDGSFNDGDEDTRSGYVYAQSADGQWYGTIANTTSGTHNFPGLPTGEYSLYFVLPNPNVAVFNAADNTRLVKEKTTRVEGATYIDYQTGEHSDGPFVVSGNQDVAVATGVTVTEEGTAFQAGLSSVSAAATVTGPGFETGTNQLGTVAFLDGDNALGSFYSSSNSYLATVEDGSATTQYFLESEVSIVVSPIDGYEVSSVTAYASSRSNALPVTNTADGVYSVERSGVNESHDRIYFEVELAETVVPSTESLVINEVYVSSAAYEDKAYPNAFIELYNPTDEPIDLTGWSIQTRTPAKTDGAIAVYELSGTVPANSFFLIQGLTHLAWQEEPQTQLPTPDLTLNVRPNLLGGALILNDSTEPIGNVSGDLSGQFVDVVGWQNADRDITTQSYETTALDVALTGPNSFERVETGVDTDNNSVDFAPQPTPTPTNSLGETEAPVATGHLQVTYFDDDRPDGVYGEGDELKSGLLYAQDADGNWYGTGVNRETGLFNFADLPAGEYQVYFQLANDRSSAFDAADRSRLEVAEVPRVQGATWIDPATGEHRTFTVSAGNRPVATATVTEDGVAELSVGVSMNSASAAVTESGSTVNTHELADVTFLDGDAPVASYESPASVIHLAVTEEGGRTQYNFINDTVSAVVTPDEGYEIVSVTAGDLEVTAGENGVYTVNRADLSSNTARVEFKIEVAPVAAPVATGSLDVLVFKDNDLNYEYDTDIDDIFNKSSNNNVLYLEDADGNLYGVPKSSNGKWVTDGLPVGEYTLSVPTPASTKQTETMFDNFTDELVPYEMIEAGQPVQIIDPETGEFTAGETRERVGAVKRITITENQTEWVAFGYAQIKASAVINVTDDSDVASQDAASVTFYDGQTELESMWIDGANRYRAMWSTADGNRAYFHNEEITIVVEPAEGFQVDEVTVTSGSTTLTPVAGENNTFTIQRADLPRMTSEAVFHVSVSEIEDTTPEPTPTGTEEPTPTGTEEPTPTGTEEPTPTGTEEPTPTGTEEPTPTGTEEPTPTGTEEPTPTGTEEPTPTGTEEPTPTGTEEPTPTGTESPRPTETDGDDDNDQQPASPDLSVSPDRLTQTESLDGVNYEGRGFTADTVRIEVVQADGTVTLIDDAAEVVDGAFNGVIIYQDEDGNVYAMPVGVHTLRITQEVADGEDIVVEATFEVVGDTSGTVPPKDDDGKDDDDNDGKGDKGDNVDFDGKDHDGGLAQTGADNGLLMSLAVGALLLLAGAGVMLQRRRA